jgi:hypothetical protein
MSQAWWPLTLGNPLEHNGEVLFGLVGLKLTRHLAELVRLRFLFLRIGFCHGIQT